MRKKERKRDASFLQQMHVHARLATQIRHQIRKKKTSRAFAACSGHLHKQNLSRISVSLRRYRTKNRERVWEADLAPKSSKTFSFPTAGARCFPQKHPFRQAIIIEMGYCARSRSQTRLSASAHRKRGFPNQHVLYTVLNTLNTVLQHPDLFNSYNIIFIY